MGNSFSNEKGAEEHELAGKDVGIVSTILKDGIHIVEDTAKALVDVGEKIMHVAAETTMDAAEVVVDAASNVVTLAVKVHRVLVVVHYTGKGEKDPFGGKAPIYKLSLEVLVPVVLSESAMGVTVEVTDEAQMAQFKEYLKEGKIAEISDVHLTFVPFLTGSNYSIEASVIAAIYAKLIEFFGSSAIPEMRDPTVRLHLKGFGMASTCVYQNMIPRFTVWGMKLVFVDFELATGDVHSMGLSDSGVWMVV